jgi:hypothetical protein
MRETALKFNTPVSTEKCLRISPHPFCKLLFTADNINIRRTFSGIYIVAQKRFRVNGLFPLFIQGCHHSRHAPPAGSKQQIISALGHVQNGPYRLKNNPIPRL